MQRTTPDGVVISCDFCGTDWDPYDQTQALPMTEGHHGSVLCLRCLQHAIEQAEKAEDGFTCTMCLRERKAGTRCWTHPGPQPSAGLNPGAIVCWACVNLAARTFAKDKDVDFELPDSFIG